MKRGFLSTVAVISMGCPVAVAAEADGTTPLLWAADANEVRTVRALVASGADVMAANRYGVTALSVACRNGNAEMARLLLDGGAGVETKLAGGETALMTAARTGRVECVKLLVERGALVDAREHNGQTALMWAAAEGHLETVDFLIDSGADIRVRLKSGFSALMFAVRQGQMDVVHSLLKAGADVNEAAMPVKPNGKLMRPGTAPLMLAVENGHFELALALVAAGADPNDQRSGFAPLHAVTWVRKTQRGDGEDGNPPPAGSGMMGSLEFVKEMVTCGADVNARARTGSGGGGRLNTKGATPFLMAAETADLPLMKVLTALGADPSIPTVDGTVPILAAAGVGVPAPGEEPATEEEAVKTVEYLLELGADLDAVDSNGETVMHGAAYKSAPILFKWLDGKGADIKVWNRKNKKGWTPLLIAQGFRFGNFRPIAVMEAAVSEVMARHGVETPPAPERSPQR